MKTYTTRKSQSLKNIAVQLYGNVDAVAELLRLNDLAGKFLLPVEMNQDEQDIAYSLKENMVINYDEASVLVNKKALQDLHQGKWQTRDGLIIATGYEIPRVFSDEFDDTFA